MEFGSPFYQTALHSSFVDVACFCGLMTYRREVFVPFFIYTNLSWVMSPTKQLMVARKGLVSNPLSSNGFPSTVHFILGAFKSY